MMLCTLHNNAMQHKEARMHMHAGFFVEWNSSGLYEPEVPGSNSGSDCDTCQHNEAKS